MNIITDYQELENKIRNCRECPLYKTRKNAVPGEGSMKAKLMIIAEAPGYNEDITGKPFVGRSGELLDEIFKRVNLSREDIYISNIVKCRPPSNRKPTPEEINSCIDYLKNQIVIIRPKIVLLFGSVALRTIFTDKYSITRSRGKWLYKRGIYYLPTWHPSAVVRDKSKLKEFYRDISLAKLALDKLEKQIDNE